MSPEHFFGALTYGEADDYLAGINRRCHHGYNQARMITSIIGKLFAKDYKVETFPWEDDRHDAAPPPTEQEVLDLTAEARAWEAKLNKKDH